MGMVGTLIGLVQMFSSMRDTSAIGGAMAVALLATLYGALLANLVALPIARGSSARAARGAGARAARRTARRPGRDRAGHARDLHEVAA
jgi:chemotaxis protein MotA